MHSCLLHAQILFDNRNTHKISPAFYDALLVIGILLGCPPWSLWWWP